MKITIKKIMNQLIEYVPTYIVTILIFVCIKKVLLIPNYDIVSIGNMVDCLCVISIFITIRRATRKQTTNIMVDNKKVEF